MLIEEPAEPKTASMAARILSYGCAPESGTASVVPDLVMRIYGVPLPPAAIASL